MARHRRLSAAFLVALALAALVAAATVAGGGERRAAIDGGVGTTLQSQHTEQALTPARRQSAGQDSLVVIAVLAGLVGVATTRGVSARRLARSRCAITAVPGYALWRRGPPPLLPLS